MKSFYEQALDCVHNNDYAKAMELYKKGELEGDVRCSFGLARLLFNGQGIEKDEEKANEIFAKVFEPIQTLAQNGDMFAQKIMGHYYYYGHFVEKNDEKAIKWYEKSADQGDANAQDNCGIMYYEGLGVEQSFEKAIYWHEKAAEQGHAKAQYNLALMYYVGEGVEQSFEKTIYWYEKSAEQGDAKAQNNLADMYYEGKGVERDYEKAIVLYKKAAEQGHPDAQYRLAWMYDYGEGIERAYDKAVYWYEKSAKQGGFGSFEALGDIYNEGRVGVRKNIKKAQDYYKKAFNEYKELLAVKGNYFTQRDIADAYEHGKGVEIDTTQANYWWKEYAKTIQAEAENGDCNAQLNLGLLYEKGEILQQSFEKAAYWYRKSMEQGDEYATCQLAELYANGLLGKRDISKAIELYEKIGLSIYQGFESIGHIYYEGRGVERDLRKAEYYYKKAIEENGSVRTNLYLGRVYQKLGAEQDLKKAVGLFEKLIQEDVLNSNAYSELADCYAKGKGVERDEIKAKELYRKSFETAKQTGEPLGRYYLRGIGTRKNYKRALQELLKENKSLKRMAPSEYTQYRIGQIYEQGLGVKKDYLQAKEWYEKSALQGFESAQLALGKLYYFGKGVEQNYKKAVQFFALANQVTGDGEPYYYLADCYHHGLGIKADWKKAKRYYEKAIALGYNCGYALEMVKIDLGEYNKVSKMREYADGIMALNLSGESLKERIMQDLKNDFGTTWEYLKPNAKTALISGVITYLTFYSMGEEFCKELDFAAVIMCFAKALETELAEYFFTGYIAYLKKKGVSASVFDEKQCFLNVEKENGEEIARSYRQENEVKYFSLGSLYYIIDSKFEDRIIGSEYRISGRSVAYRKGYRFRDGVRIEGERTISKYMAKYADQLFSKEAFTPENRQKEIVNYLVDLASDVKTIMDYRNPAAHGTTMTIKHAEVCGDYLIKVRKLICNFLGKVKG